MNTEKVFTAFNKEGEEILLYRKDKDTYIDLNSDNNEIYNKDDIDLTTLLHASESLNLRRHMLESCIKRKYKKDRERMLETKKFLIGEKLVISNYKKWYTGNDMYDAITHHRWQYDKKDYDLYIHIDTKKVYYDTIVNIYCNLYNENFYGWKADNEPENAYHIPGFKNGNEYVQIINNLFNLTSESYLDKKTINEIVYKLRKTLVK